MTLYHASLNNLARLLLLFVCYLKSSCCLGLGQRDGYDEVVASTPQWVYIHGDRHYQTETDLHLSTKQTEALWVRVSPAIRQHLEISLPVGGFWPDRPDYTGQRRFSMLSGQISRITYCLDSKASCRSLLLIPVPAPPETVNEPEQAATPAASLAQPTVPVPVVWPASTGLFTSGWPILGVIPDRSKPPGLPGLLPEPVRPDPENQAGDNRDRLPPGKPPFEPLAPKIVLKQSIPPRELWLRPQPVMVINEATGLYLLGLDSQGLAHIVPAPEDVLDAGVATVIQSLLFQFPDDETQWRLEPDPLRDFRLVNHYETDPLLVYLQLMTGVRGAIYQATNSQGETVYLWRDRQGRVHSISHSRLLQQYSHNPKFQEESNGFSEWLYPYVTYDRFRKMQAEAIAAGKKPRAAPLNKPDPEAGAGSQKQEEKQAVSLQSEKPVAVVSPIVIDSHPATGTGAVSAPPAAAASAGTGSAQSLSRQQLQYRFKLVSKLVCTLERFGQDAALTRMPSTTCLLWGLLPITSVTTGFAGSRICFSEPLYSLEKLEIMATKQMFDWLQKVIPLFLTKESRLDDAISLAKILRDFPRQQVYSYSHSGTLFFQILVIEYLDDLKLAAMNEISFFVPDRKEWVRLNQLNDHPVLLREWSSLQEAQTFDQLQLIQQTKWPEYLTPGDLQLLKQITDKIESHLHIWQQIHTEARSSPLWLLKRSSSGRFMALGYHQVKNLFEQKGSGQLTSATGQRLRKKQNPRTMSRQARARGYDAPGVDRMNEAIRSSEHCAELSQLDTLFSKGIVESFKTYRAITNGDRPPFEHLFEVPYLGSGRSLFLKPPPAHGKSRQHNDFELLVTNSHMLVRAILLILLEKVKTDTSGFTKAAPIAAAILLQYVHYMDKPVKKGYQDIEPEVVIAGLLALVTSISKQACKNVQFTGDWHIPVQVLLVFIATPETWKKFTHSLKVETLFTLSLSLEVCKIRGNHEVSAAIISLVGQKAQDWPMMGDEVPFAEALPPRMISFLKMLPRAGHELEGQAIMSQILKDLLDDIAGLPRKWWSSEDLQWQSEARKTAEVILKQDSDLRETRRREYTEELIAAEQSQQTSLKQARETMKDQRHERRKPVTGPISQDQAAASDPLASSSDAMVREPELAGWEVALGRALELYQQEKYSSARSERKKALQKASSHPERAYIWSEYGSTVIAGDLSRINQLVFLGKRSKKLHERTKGLLEQAKKYASSSGQQVGGHQWLDSHPLPSQSQLTLLMTDYLALAEENVVPRLLKVMNEALDCFQRAVILLAKEGKTEALSPEANFILEVISASLEQLHDNLELVSLIRRNLQDALTNRKDILSVLGLTRGRPKVASQAFDQALSDFMATQALEDGLLLNKLWPGILKDVMKHARTLRPGRDSL